MKHLSWHRAFRFVTRRDYFKTVSEVGNYMNFWQLCNTLADVKHVEVICDEHDYPIAYRCPECGDLVYYKSFSEEDWGSDEISCPCCGVII